VSNIANRESINLLFVCSRNQWRSPTAENVYARRAGVNARSCGTSPNARRTVSAQDLRWADLVFVMEDKHKERLLREFAVELRDKELHVLHISDSWKFMDPELVSEITAGVDLILARHLE